MRILLTGGAGFIGSHLCRALLAIGHQVMVFDDFSRGNQNNVPTLEGAGIYSADIRHREAVLDACIGIDEVIHLAYINGTKTFYEHPAFVMDVAVKGMLNILEGCRKRGVRRFMLASSSEVCRAMVGGMDEMVPLVIPTPFNPRYSYSAGKIISEMMLIHSKQFDWLSIIRPFNIYGPNMAPGHVVPDFAKQLDDRLREVPDAKRIPFSILGSGDETRSFCYIDDFIAGVMLVRNRAPHMEIYNVGVADETSIRLLAQKMGEIRGVELDISEGGQLPEGGIQRRRPDISKLKLLGYLPRMSLDEGLRRVLCQ